MNQSLTETQDHEDRYFLYAIGVEADLDAQLDAIRDLLERHRAADHDLTEEMKRLEARAHAATGRANELAVDDRGNVFHTSIYRDAAHSLAAVGMLAPLLESIITQSFSALHATFDDALAIAAPR